MKLNHDCIRDLLLVVENYGTLDHIGHDQLMSYSELEVYDEDTIIYTALRLFDAGYLIGNNQFYMDDKIYLTISAISYNGHQFLDTIRDTNVWKHVKEKSSSLASVSIQLLGELGVAYSRKLLGL